MRTKLQQNAVTETQHQTTWNAYNTQHPKFTPKRQHKRSNNTSNGNNRKLEMRQNASSNAMNKNDISSKLQLKRGEIETEFIQIQNGVQNATVATRKRHQE